MYYLFVSQVCELQSNKSCHIGWCTCYGSGGGLFGRGNLSVNHSHELATSHCAFVDKIALCGTMDAHLMFFLEHFMKTLKDFVMQSARPKGSMVEGWLIQDPLVYFSEFLS